MSTWSPTNKGSNFTLSNGNLTASNSTAGVWQSLQGTTSHNSSKWYFEITLSSAPISLTNFMVGVGNASQTFTNFLGVDANSNGLQYISGSGGSATWKSNYNATTTTVTTTGPLPATGSVFGIAVDVTNALIWFSHNGTWLAGNPAAGTGGTALGVTGAIFIAAASDPNGGNTIIDVLDPSFITTYAPPSGFTVWDGGDPVSETGNAKDTVTLFRANQPQIITETGAAHDSPSETTKPLQFGIVERGNLRDRPSERPQGSTLAVVETGQALDAYSIPGGAAKGGLLFWGYDYLAGQLATVWCAGLDCGDHTVNANGSVFVPWQSDPDGLLTAAFLQSLSNNPPAGGFGPSACNVDVTISGVLTRLVVDAAIGLKYTSSLQPLAPDVPLDAKTQTGPTIGEIRRVIQVGMKLVNSGPPSVGGGAANLLQVTFQSPAHQKYLLSQPYSGVWWDGLQADYEAEDAGDQEVMVSITRPYPLVVTSLGGQLHTSEREGGPT